MMILKKWNPDKTIRENAKALKITYIYARTFPRLYGVSFKSEKNEWVPDYPVKNRENNKCFAWDHPEAIK